MNARNAFRRLLELSREQPGYQIRLTLMGLGSAALSALIPLRLKTIFDSMADSKAPFIVQSVVFILVLYSLSVAIDLIACFISNVAETRAGALLKKRLLLRAIDLPWAYYQHHGKGEVLSKTMSDTESIGRNISLFPALIIEIGSLFLAILVLFKLNTILGFLTLATLPVYLISMRSFIGRLKRFSGEERQKYGHVMEVFRDSLDGLQEIKLFRAISHFAAKVTFVLDGWMKSVKSVALFQTANYGIQSYLSTFFPLLVLGVGAVLNRAGLVTIGVVIAAFSYLGRLYRPVERLAYLWSGLIRDIPTMDRVYELLDYPPGEAAGEAKPEQCDLEFAAVKWRYEQAPVLNGIDLSIAANEKVAIVGRSGAGKSTIAWLLLGLFEPESGQILLGDRPLASYDGDELRRCVGYAPANPHIFQGTLHENVTLGLDCDPNEIETVLRICGLDIFDPAKALGEGFGDLSLGQKQRIGLARVILRKPHIIILDEATSGIDSQTEEAILDHIFDLDATVIVMSHRISTVKRCPRVVLLWEGLVAVEGTHDELVATDLNYRVIFRDQLAPNYQNLDIMAVGAGQHN